MLTGMRKIGRTGAVLGAALTALAVTWTPLRAQASADTTGSVTDTLVFRGDPIVVTATRGPREVSLTPRPVSVVQRRDLLEKMPNTVSDLFRTLPGLDVAGVGVNQGRPQIRGQKGQRILLLADGLRLNNSRRQQDFGELPALVDVHAVEQVEIVRGPASVLYGSDAIGGVVNIITRVPRVQGLHGEASLRYGDVENQRTGAFQVYGRFGDVSLRAGGTVRRADAYEAPAGTFGNIRLDRDAVVEGTGTRDRNLNVRLGYDFGPRHHTFAQVDRYDAEKSGFGSVDPALYDPDGVPIHITYPFQDFTRVTAGYRGEELGAALADRLEILAYGQDNERQLNFGVGPFPAGPGAIEINNLNETDIRSYGLRAEARKLAAPGLLLTYGLDVWRDHALGTDIGTTSMVGFGPVPIERVDSTPQLPEATYLSAGLFAQGEIEATDRLSLVAGARWQHVQAETFETPGLDQEPVSITDATAVAALNALFRVTDEVSLVVSVGRGFRSPNLIERFFDGPTPEGSGYQVRNPDLGPEKSFNVDVGVRVRGERLVLEAFAFRNKITDGIRIEALDYEVEGFQAHRNVNVDQLLFRGVELNGDLALGGGFSLRSTFTWMDTENLLDVENPVGEAYATKLTGTLRYDAPGGRFWAEGEVRHNGEQKEVDFGEANPVGPVAPAFTVAHLRGGIRVWRSESGMTHRLLFAVTNLTNELYAEFSNVGFFRPEPKRNLTLAWNVSF